MNLQDAIQQLKVRAVEHKLDNEKQTHQGLICRPYFDNSLTYSKYIVLNLDHPGFNFYIEDGLAWPRYQKKLPSEESWQVLGKDDWVIK